MAAAIKWVRHEVREMLPSFIFFLVAFELIVVTEALSTEQYGIRPFHVIAGVVAALLVAKALLLANLTPWVDAFPDKPLLYNTIWKSMIYVTAVLIVWFLEKAIEGLIDHSTITAALHRAADAFSHPRFWAVQIWLIVLVIVYAAAQELARSYGSAELRARFLGR